MKVLDWMVDMLGLPKHFKFCESSHGGGVIHGTASEATLVALLIARSKALREANEQLLAKGPDLNNNEPAATNQVEQYQQQQQQASARVTIDHLVGYCSDLAHSSVERAGLLGGVRIKPVQSDDDCRLRGHPLRQQILADKANGLVPFFVVATLGTTSVCSFDDLHEIGLVAREFNLWLHVDAAYAGSAFICPENRQFLRGIEVSKRVATNKITLT